MSSPARVKNLNVWHVVALGIGSMVGAGIFALLGQAALVVHSGTWISFMLGGVIALLSGYSYARLGAHYPSAGGIIHFFRVGLPSRTLAIALSLLYLITLALTIAMVARSFGDYGARLFHEPPLLPERVKAYAAGIIILLAALNFMGSAAAGRVELLFVGVKLAILLLLMVAGAATIRPELLQLHGSKETADSLLSSVGLTFFAYAGYGMMANAAADVANPGRTMPRAFMLAIGITMTLYVLLALVVLGNVAPAELARYADTAVAQAAYPVLGKTGFTIVALGALLATSSAINATMFSALNITQDMGAGGELPPMFARRIWRQATPGIVMATALVLVLTITLDIGALASVASATFLICYLAIFVAAWRLRKQIKASPLLLVLGFVMMATVFVGFLASLVRSGWTAPAIVAGALLLCALLASKAPPKNDRPTK